jgi:PAS domain S-box-containing protein
MASEFESTGHRAKELKEVELDPRDHLGAIIASSDDAIISKTLDGTIISWNPAATRIFGYQADEIVGRSILTLIPPELHHEEDEIQRRLRFGERIEHFETTRIRKNGERFPISVTISPIRDSTGTIVGASKIARDFSDKKQVERLLIQAEKLAATGRMAATIAHEINNPLEALMNLIYLARKSCEKEPEAEKLLLIAEDELGRVAHIARRTLGYYRDTGISTEMYIHDLIENVLAVYNPKMVQMGVSVDRRFEELQKVLVSKGEMLQVFSNVIANAIDAMPEGGVLTVSARKVGRGLEEGVQVVIEDGGHGIEPENLPHIFDAFFSTKGNLGTGIGLWVAKQLVEQRGGQIAITSRTTSKDSGTAVTIFVPFAVPVASSEPHRRSL